MATRREESLRIALNEIKSISADPLSRQLASQALAIEERDPTAEMMISLMVALFVYAESNGYCFDVLVREAIERGERA